MNSLGILLGHEGISSATTNQDIGASNRRQLQVLHGALLQLNVRVADLTVAAEHLLDGGLGLWEQVDELDVG